ncbi:MAG: universal stress protein [Thermodesulfovibrionia bacterium]|nr:universal stress protein [Thermodesulfovibrionia bacterium]
MFKNILVPIDNSKCSNYSIDMGVTIAEKMVSHVTGSHVYSATLHDKRFKDMEDGLPPPYQAEERLKRSRRVHNSLIGDGLRLISNAYLDVFEKKCLEKNVSCGRKLMEGKNWFELVKDVRESRYDLVIIGVRGLGAVNGTFMGSVCERVVRNISTDVLVVKNDTLIDERIVVAIDGSNRSFSALGKALELSTLFNVEVEAVSVFDPYFHTSAFKSLVGVLSKEAGEKFKFKEQEKLHDEVINTGLKKVYQEHLTQAIELGKKRGIKVITTLLAGKPYHEICRYVDANSPSLLVISRYGAHQADEPHIGNTAENILRLSKCNILLT